MKKYTKDELRGFLKKMEDTNEKNASRLTKQASLTDYANLTYLDEKGLMIWTSALQKALDDNELVIIPASEIPYYIDSTIIIPSNRFLEAKEGAIIRQKENVKLLMLRNSNTQNGTNKPIDKSNPNRNITISGGRWEESYTERRGYGDSGMYDEERSFYGVSTCMLFNNIEGLTLKNMTFSQTASFAVQCGDIKNASFNNIKLVNCFADGIHINGNTENIVLRNISGEVGDDLIALNMYDWQNSSINFGPGKNILCENISLSPSSPCKAIRIQPGIYYFEDEQPIECSIKNLIFTNVKGIKTFKLYFQTPAHPVDKLPERGGVASANNLFFKDIDIYLDSPIDALDEYINSDRVKGSFAGFEVCTNIDSLTLEDINIYLDKEKYPMAFLLCVGPKSALVGDNTVEVFNPDQSCILENLYLKNIRVNEVALTDTEPYVHAIDFTPVGGLGIIKNIEIIN